MKVCGISSHTPSLREVLEVFLALEAELTGHLLKEEQILFPAIAALEGQVVPQSVKLPLAVVSDPDFKEGSDYFPDQSDNFFVGNSFPTCGINFTAQEIMGQSETDQ